MNSEKLSREFHATLNRIRLPYPQPYSNTGKHYTFYISERARASHLNSARPRKLSHLNSARPRNQRQSEPDFEKMIPAKAQPVENEPSENPTGGQKKRQGRASITPLPFISIHHPTWQLSKFETNLSRSGLNVRICMTHSGYIALA